MRVRYSGGTTPAPSGTLHDRPPLIIAHGGLGVKNTLDSCRQALLMGPAVEVDVRLSADGQPILGHDAVIDEANLSKVKRPVLNLLPENEVPEPAPGDT